MFEYLKDWISEKEDPDDPPDPLHPDDYSFKAGQLFGLRTISMTILIAVFVCLVGAIYNIYYHLYKPRMNKTLITAFYATLVLMLLLQFVQWTCQYIDPHLYAILFYMESPEKLGESSWSLYYLFVCMTMLSSVFNYALNWVVIATIMDLSWTICVLSGSLARETYFKRGKWGFVLASLTTLLYAGAFAWVMVKESKGQQEQQAEATQNLQWVVICFYSFQGIMYTATVFVCLLPAMKRLDTMMTERASILKQFFIFMFAIAVRIIVQVIFVITSSAQSNNYWVLATYFVTFMITALAPSFYMLLSHHKTFKANEEFQKKNLQLLQHQYDEPEVAEIIIKLPQHNRTNSETSGSLDSARNSGQFVSVQSAQESSTLAQQKANKYSKEVPGMPSTAGAPTNSDKSKSSISVATNSLNDSSRQVSRSFTQRNSFSRVNNLLTSHEYLQMHEEPKEIRVKEIGQKARGSLNLMLFESEERDKLLEGTVQGRQILMFGKAHAFLPDRSSVMSDETQFALRRLSTGRSAVSGYMDKEITQY